MDTGLEMWTGGPRLHTQASGPRNPFCSLWTALSVVKAPREEEQNKSECLPPGAGPLSVAIAAEHITPQTQQLQTTCEEAFIHLFIIMADGPTASVGQVSRYSLITSSDSECQFGFLSLS